jgi:hypothetical protein
MDTKELLDLEKIIIETNASVKSAHKRIDELQLITKAFYELASDVKVMVNEMSTMKQDITDIKGDIEEYHHKNPNKLLFNAKNAIIIGIVSALLGALLALIIK